MKTAINTTPHTFNFKPSTFNGAKHPYGEYVGRPWINGQYDCWTLVRDVYRDQLGIELPNIVVDCDNLRQVIRAFEDDINLSPWQPIEQPDHLCLVFFTPGHERATHCGVWLDIADGRFLHCTRTSGSVCENRQSLEMNGWTKPRYYRYKHAV